MKSFQMSDIDREKATRMAAIDQKRKALLRAYGVKKALDSLPPATPGVIYHRVDCMVKRRRVTT